MTTLILCKRPDAESDCSTFTLEINRLVSTNRDSRYNISYIVADIYKYI